MNRLIENGVAEDLNLEFKRQLYRKTDNDQKELLKDITAFANSAGGTLLIGIAEEDHVAKKIVPIPMSDIDDEIVRIESLLQASVEPRLTSYKISTIQIDTDNCVLKVEVPSSWSKPHRSNYKKTRRFFMRNSKGNHEMSVEELRTTFVSGETRIERIRTFVEDRIEEIERRTAEGIYYGKGLVTSHIISVADFETKQDLDYPLLTENPVCLPSGYGGGVTLRPNLDGFFGEFLSENKVLARGQIYRSGSIEMVMSDYRHQMTSAASDRFDGRYATLRIVRNVARSIEGLRSLSRNSPFIVFVNLLGFEGAELYLPPELSNGLIDNVSDRHRMSLPNVVVENYSDEADLAVQLRSMLDALWNGFGFNACTSFTKDGSWAPN